jgi:hypothetical protein
MQQTVTLTHRPTSRRGRAYTFEKELVVLGWAYTRSFMHKSKVISVVCVHRNRADHQPESFLTVSHLLLWWQHNFDQRKIPEPITDAQGILCTQSSEYIMPQDERARGDCDLCANHVLHCLSMRDDNMKFKPQRSGPNWDTATRCSCTLLPFL